MATTSLSKCQILDFGRNGLLRNADFLVLDELELRDFCKGTPASWICDDRKIEAESAAASRLAKSMNKKQVLSISSTKNKRQRSQGNNTDLLKVSESDDDKKDRNDSDESTRSLDEKYNKPKALNGMKNILEVCQWLIERPYVLVMTNQMYNAMNTSLDLPLVNNIPTALISKATAAISANDEKALARLWHEEIKCLFPGCRAPPDDAIGNLIDAKVHEFREIRVKKGKTTALARSEIEEFMTSEVVEQISNRH
ncbi:hypothetical protein C1646_754842 [Rhizophagus diaphanus]|nr:hypothetical protein C1646_754842 [Rhizophagus diaphanus] [Rhizophagus sp. MUCL 43196]